jgi:hypothetical protein
MDVFISQEASTREEDDRRPEEEGKQTCPL